MSQETNHGQQPDKNAGGSFNASFWTVVILVGVFICAVNFVKVMSEEGEEGHGAAKTEMKHEGHEGTEAKTGEAAHEEHAAEAAPKADSARH